MKNSLLAGSLALFALCASAKDPVAMTVNGKDVKLSEFEYLYNKNKQQQLEEQPFDKYVDMFVTYKMKVADAEAAGIDTTKTFIDEFNGYRADLAKTYLEDKTVNDRLAHEAYERKKEEVEVAHIMLPLKDPATQSALVSKNRLDSIRQCVLNGQDFGELAAKYSIDKSAPRNKGNLGFIMSGSLPYEFEVVAYNTPVGGISEVFKTAFGYHFVKVLDRRPTRGQVFVQHILKLVDKNATDEVRNAAKAKIDSIYAELKAGASFDELAKTESDDPGSKSQGGRLPWFGSGRMVPEFESVAFALNNGEMSEPIATAYGYHIIKKLDSRGVQDFESVKDNIMMNIERDSRAGEARAEKMRQLKEEYKLKLDPKGRDAILNALTTAVSDSAAIASLSNSKLPVASFVKNKVTVSDVVASWTASQDPMASKESVVDDNINTAVEKAIIDYEISILPNKYADFSNLLNEYRDGLLLFEISNQKVWDRASKDAEGLENYFNENKDKYKWESPKYKGFLIQTENDSIASLIKSELPSIGVDSLVSTLKKAHKHHVRIDRMLVSEGENKLIDALVFKKDSTFVNPNKKYPVYFTYDGKIVSVPENVNDVRGQVTSDYQNVLEARWVEELKTKYKVKLNNKVLNKLKSK